MKHLHSLPNRKLVDWFIALSKGHVEAAVKYDGVAMTLGVDQLNRPYVSREGKEGKDLRYYSIAEVPVGPQYAAYQIAAHSWFHPLSQAYVDAISSFGHDVAWNVEVVFPNVNVIYYKDISIVFLCQATTSTPTIPHEYLHDRFVDIEVINKRYDPVYILRREYPCSFVSGNLEVSIIEEYQPVFFQVAVSLNSQEISQIIDVNYIFEWLHTRDVLTDYPYQSILTANLSLFNPQKRTEIAARRAELTDEFRLVVRNSYIENPDIETVEGYVLTNILHDSIEPVKIVYDRYVIANQKLHAIRNCVKKRTFNTDANILSHVPYVDPELYHSIQLLWKKLKAQNEELASECVIEATKMELEGRLRTLLNTYVNHEAKRLDLPSMRSIHSRNLITFALAFKELGVEITNL